MAQLIDFEASDLPTNPVPPLSQHALEMVALLSEEQLRVPVQDICSDVPLTNGGKARENQCPRAGSTISSQFITPDAPLNFSPALTARTSDVVIADLQRGRQKRRHGVDTTVLLSSKQATEESLISANDHYGGNDEEAGDIESEPEEVFVPSKQRRISERKRIQNAALDTWFQNYQRQQAKALSNVSNRDNEALSVRYMVKQAESRRIISTPREYQVELFERAKTDNIIAVLDTGKPWSKLNRATVLTRRQGSGKTLIAVLLLRHILEQELEDRARGKPKRVAFFLV